MQCGNMIRRYGSSMGVGDSGEREILEHRTERLDIAAER